MAVAVQSLHATRDARHAELFAAFIVTLVPFYHGTQRFLDDQYAFQTGAGTPQWALLFDFTLLFAEACALIALASAGGSVRHFGLLLILLLLVDIVWNVVGRAIRTGDWSPMWARINIPTAVIVAVLLASYTTAAVLAVVATARTVVDYRLHLAWYLGEAIEGSPSDGSE